MDAANADAWDLWRTVATQWRAGFDRLIGLDYTVVYAEADRLAIELSVCTMEKIRALERIVLERNDE